MSVLLAITFFVLFFYLLIQFARQEEIQEVFEEAVIDVEGRLEWARTRSTCPFGMKAQLDVSKELLGRAKGLWENNKWQQAYQVALQSQKAMNRAQSIYSSIVKKR